MPNSMSSGSKMDKRPVQGGIAMEADASMQSDGSSSPSKSPIEILEAYCEGFKI